ncbi:sensor histidine kinase [Microbacterium sp. JB110]|uniref:sensor histidine kinase n=1 Tax=Microbacterium sp. JB110 TaxID=2024477 RepID=UPI00097E897D|nr:histidine kinase [Microbacterium sp. JB110]RCS61289.1 histidine kinase [Microbacterium sp. JB110]SJM51139.1 two-component system sensor kinase [Frigoribacterium sp. JB110]
MDTDRPTWRSRAWLVAVGLLAVLAALLSFVGVDRPASAWAAVAVAAAVAVSVIGWAFDRTRRQRRRYEEDLAAWAGERATQAERLRIAADLHDLVSHGLGLITVRAAVARTLAGPDGASERAEALTDIERVSRETTTELRRMLAVLRDPETAPFRPADTLDDLPSIVEEATAAGITSSLDVEELGDVSPGVQLTICAVVRETLHNTIRHAGPTRVRVTVRRDGETIVVDVQDAGPRGSWQPQPGAGHGLDGLRERVTILGGDLQTQPNEHGYRVTARIPDVARP